MIDETALLAWLKERSHIRSTVGGAIYQGLADRIRNGQFEKEGDEHSG